MVIPVIFRRKLHFEAGEELIIKIIKNEMRVISSKQALKNAQDRVQELAKGVSLVDKLKILRKEDGVNE